jgi:hypothetical protein
MRSDDSHAFVSMLHRDLMPPKRVFHAFCMRERKKAKPLD